MPWGLMLRCSQNFSQLCSGVVSGLQHTEGMHLVNSYLEVITECREPAPPGLHREEEHCQQLSGVGPSLLSMVRLPGVQGWCWAPQNSSGESQRRVTTMMEEHLSFPNTGASFMWGKADRAGPLSLEKRRLRGILPMCTHTDGVEQMEPGFSLWCLVMGQEALTTTWNMGNFI